MIPNSSKFPMRTEFLRFRSRAKRVTAAHLTAFFAQTAHHSRLSVVVPAKVSKLAVTRTWLRRLTYDALWPSIKDKNIDCVVVYKPLPLAKSPANKIIIITELNSLNLEN